MFERNRPRHKTAPPPESANDGGFSSPHLVFDAHQLELRQLAQRQISCSTAVGGWMKEQRLRNGSTWNLIRRTPECPLDKTGDSLRAPPVAGAGPVAVPRIASHPSGAVASCRPGTPAPSVEDATDADVVILVGTQVISSQGTKAEIVEGPGGRDGEVEKEPGGGGDEVEREPGGGCAASVVGATHLIQMCQPHQLHVMLKDVLQKYVPECLHKGGSGGVAVRSLDTPCWLAPKPTKRARPSEAHSEEECDGMLMAEAGHQLGSSWEEAGQQLGLSMEDELDTQLQDESLAASWVCVGGSWVCHPESWLSTHCDPATGEILMEPDGTEESLHCVPQPQRSLRRVDTSPGMVPLSPGANTQEVEEPRNVPQERISGTGGGDDADASSAALVDPNFKADRELLSNLSHDCVHSLIQGMVTTEAGLHVSKLVLSTLLLPRLMDMQSAAKRALLDAVAHAAASHPRSLLEAVMKPLVSRPSLLGCQSQLIVKTAKDTLQRGELTMRCDLLLVCCAEYQARQPGASHGLACQPGARGFGASSMDNEACFWTDVHVALVQALVDLKPTLPAESSTRVVSALLRAMLVASEQSTMASSTAFSRLLLSVLSNYGAVAAVAASLGEGQQSLLAVIAGTAFC
eukprot:gene19988-26703_t